MGAVGLLVALSAGGAAQPVVRIVAADDPGAIEAASALHQALAGGGRVDARGAVEVATEPPPREDLEPLRRSLEQAYHRYVALEPVEARALLGPAQAALALRLDEPAAVHLLARSYRILALARLYEGAPADAARAFGLAAALEPSFTPSAESWPPQARLAYADAVADLRREGTGILTVEVEPRAAAVWLDGRRVGTGPTTLKDLLPGEHVVLATGPGLEPVAAVVEVQGGGKLDTTTLFLPAKEGDEARAERVAAAVASLDGPDEGPHARLAAEALEADALVVVATGPAGARRATVLDRQGERAGPPVELTEAHAATLIEGQILGEPVVARPIAPPPAAPVEADRAWYERWEVWTIAGVAVAAAAGITAGVVVSQQPTERLRFHFGGAR